VAGLLSYFVYVVKARPTRPRTVFVAGELREFSTLLLGVNGENGDWTWEHTYLQNVLPADLHCHSYITPQHTLPQPSLITTLSPQIFSDPHELALRRASYVFRDGEIGSLRGVCKAKLLFTLEDNNAQYIPGDTEYAGHVNFTAARVVTVER
jgi:hypothetical protein